MRKANSKKWKRQPKHHVCEAMGRAGGHNGAEKSRPQRSTYRVLMKSIGEEKFFFKVKERKTLISLLSMGQRD